MQIADTLHIVVMAWDLTLKKQARAALQQQQALLEYRVQRHTVQHRANQALSLRATQRAELSWRWSRSTSRSTS